MTTDRLFCGLAVAVLAGLAAFQVLLILGKPLGRFAWGGQHEVLPTRLRVGSCVGVAIYAVAAVVFLARANLLPMVTPDHGGITFGTWVLAVYFTLGIALNAISRSRPERLVMTPVALLLAVSGWVLAA